MGTELVKEVNFDSFKEKVRSKVREVLLDAMPQDAIDGLIQAEYKNFFQDKTTGDSWNKKTTNEFREMVQRVMTEELTPVIKEQIKKYIDSNQPYNTAEGVSALARQLAPAVAESIHASIASNLLNRIRNGSY